MMMISHNMTLTIARAKILFTAQIHKLAGREMHMDVIMLLIRTDTIGSVPLMITFTSLQEVLTFVCFKTLTHRSSAVVSDTSV